MMAVKAINNRKYFIILVAAITTTFFVMITNRPNGTYYEGSVIEINNNNIKPSENWRGLTTDQISNLSVLGKVLFMNKKPPNQTQQTYEILVWKYGKTIEDRHLKQFGSNLIDPFENCPVKNCKITYSDNALKTADLVIFHLHRMQEKDIPKRNESNGLWAFLTDESPYHTFMHPNNVEKYNGIFNWSMTYRMDSDIPVPYGRTIVQDSIIEPIKGKRRDVLVSIMGSNCNSKNKRWEYIKELQKYIQVDVYGACGPLKTCPGHFRVDCHDIDTYLFYLAFENSNCDEYVTEKLWWNAYQKNSIPIVMGASQKSYQQLLPPKSFLNVDDYAHPKDLATHILYLNKSETYKDYYTWKRNYKVLNEHGYFGSNSYHYCRACQALNYNNRTRVYSDFKQFWSVKRDCHPPWKT